MKFYKKTNGKWLVGEYAIPAGTCFELIKDEDNRISVVSVNGYAYVENALYSDLQKQDGTPYASMSEYETATADFFVKAPASGGGTIIPQGEIDKLASYPVLGNTPDTYLANDGFWKPVVVGSGGYASNLYLSNTESSITGYKSLSYTNDTTKTTFSGTSVNNQEVLIEEFIFNKPLGVTTIDAGTWRFSILGKVSNTGAETYMRMKIYVKKQDSLETLLFEVTSLELNNLVDERFVFESVLPIYVVNPTDVLLLKTYVITTSGANKTLTFYTGGISSSYLNTPLPLRHTQLRDPNGDTNVLHVTQTLLNKISATGDQELVTRAQVAQMIAAAIA